MGNKVATIPLLVVGAKSAGKTYFIDKVTVGQIVFAGKPTKWIHEMTLVFGKTEFLIKEYPRKTVIDFDWSALVFILRTDSTREELLVQRNTLLAYSAQKRDAPVVVIHHVVPKSCHTFEERNNFLQVTGLRKVLTCEIDYTTKWRPRMDSVFRWLAANASES